MPAIDCPDEQTLGAFAIGNLAGEPWQRIAKHLENCPDCQQRLEDFDDAGDGLVTELTQLPAKKPADGDRTFHLVADAGSDLARRLAEGPVRLNRFELEAEL